jgi:trehalose/maltose hydrolase-like predicted phosphorylase
MQGTLRGASFEVKVQYYDPQYKHPSSSSSIEFAWLCTRIASISTCSFVHVGLNTAIWDLRKFSLLSIVRFLAAPNLLG